MRLSMDISTMDDLLPDREAVPPEPGTKAEPAFQFRVFVLATSIEATIAALRLAGGLAADLGAEIHLAAAEDVWPQACLPTHSLDRGELPRRVTGLVLAAGLQDEQFPRLPEAAGRGRSFRGCVPPQSILVIGGRDRFWSWKERRLREQLAGMGYQVVLAKLAAEYSIRRWWRDLFRSPDPGCRNLERAVSPGSGRASR